MATGMRLQNMYFTALLPISHQEWRTDAVYEMVDRLAAQFQPLVETRGGPSIEMLRPR
jgi:hypothetical protein